MTRAGESHGVRHAQFVRQRFELPLIGRAAWTPSLADQHEQRVGHLGEHQRDGAQQHLVTLHAAAHQKRRRERTVGLRRVEVGDVADDRPVRRDAQFPPHARAIGRGGIEPLDVLAVVDQLDVIARHALRFVQLARALAGGDHLRVEPRRPRIDFAQARRFEVIRPRDHREPHRHVGEPRRDPRQ